MPEILDLFISSHAVEQFQQRIAPMEETQARFFIGEGIRQATHRRVIPANAEHPETLRIRTRRPFPFEFRAFCVFDQERGHFVVTTIVRGNSKVTRKHNRGQEGATDQN